MTSSNPTPQSPIATIAAKIALTMALVATPLVAFGLIHGDAGQTVLAGSTQPDDVDPG